MNFPLTPIETWSILVIGAIFIVLIINVAIEYRRIDQVSQDMYDDEMQSRIDKRDGPDGR